jgi:hypothetical protein
MTAKKPRIKDADVTGLKYFSQLAPLLQRLHDDACQRDKAGNRELHFDQHCMLILLLCSIRSSRRYEQSSRPAN